MPSSLPIKTNTYFLTQRKLASFTMLASAMPEGHWVVPNARLNDLFTITRVDAEKQSRIDDDSPPFRFARGLNFCQ